MRAFAIIIAVALATPTLAFAQTYPTTNSRSGNINGDVNGDISGDLGQKKQYRYKDDTDNRPGCYKARNGNVVCK